MILDTENSPPLRRGDGANRLSIIDLKIGRCTMEVTPCPTASLALGAEHFMVALEGSGTIHTYARKDLAMSPAPTSGHADNVRYDAAANLFWWVTRWRPGRTGSRTSSQPSRIGSSSTPTPIVPARSERQRLFVNIRWRATSP